MNTEARIAAVILTFTLIMAIFGMAVAGRDEPKKPVTAPARTNAPLLTRLAPEDEVVSKTIPPPLVEYPFKQRVALDGLLSGVLVTNITDEVGLDANGLRVSVTQYVTVTAKMTIQAPWENMMLQWNYDKPVDAQTNRYKLVR